MATSLEGLDDETIKGLAALSKGLAEDPKTRRQYQALLKAQNPNLPIPELDTERRTVEYLKPHLEKIASLEQKLAEKNGVETIQGKRAGLAEKGYSKEEITSIEKLMVEKQIPSHETAAEHFRMSQQLATPTPSTLMRTNTLPVKGAEVKEAGGIRKWALSEAYKAADDLKAGRVKLAS